MFHDVAFVEKHFAGVEEDLEQLNIRLDHKSLIVISKKICIIINYH